jgi:hypothetical protein
MNVLMADTLLDTQLPGPAGAQVAAVPAVRVGELLIYPRPVIRHQDGVGPVELRLDLRRWLICLPGGASVPVECATVQAAVAAAETLRSDAQTGAISNYGPAELAKWAVWWCGHRQDAALLALGPGLSRSGGNP